MFHVRGNDGRAYRPGRDIAYMFHHIASHACHRLAQHSWHDVIKDYAEYSGLTQESLVSAAVALRRFYELACNVGVTDLSTAWVNSGLSDLPKPALLALFFELGAGWTGAWFNAAREITPAGQSAPGTDALGEVIDRAASAARETLPSRQARQAAELHDLIRDNEEKGG